MIGELTNHLWQSTLFAVAAGLLAFAFRKNRAQIRYGLWFSASLKFSDSLLLADEPSEATWDGRRLRRKLPPRLSRSPWCK